MLRQSTVLLVFVCGAFAQTRPAYEAASIKLNTTGSNSSSSNGSKGQVVFTNRSLKRLIERAYNAKPFQVTGPDWMENVHFDIAAKYPTGTTDDDRALMLRTLLEDRFKLAVHRETKEMPGYALVVAKGGFKLKPVEPGGGGSDTEHSGGSIHQLTVKRTAIPQLADLISRLMGDTVIDKTGIAGDYDFALRWADEDPNPKNTDAEPLPTLPTALQEVLGLRLQPQKVPVTIFVVDHIERTPLEN